MQFTKQNGDLKVYVKFLKQQDYSLINYKSVNETATIKSNTATSVIIKAGDITANKNGLLLVQVFNPNSTDNAIQIICDYTSK